MVMFLGRPYFFPHSFCKLMLFQSNETLMNPDSVANEMCAQICIISRTSRSAPQTKGLLVPLEVLYFWRDFFLKCEIKNKPCGSVFVMPPRGIVVTDGLCHKSTIKCNIQQTRAFLCGP